MFFFLKCIISFNPHNSSVWKVLIMIPILQMRKGELRVVSDLVSHQAGKQGVMIQIN